MLFLSRSLYMPLPSHPPWTFHPNISWCSLHLMGLPVVWCFVTSLLLAANVFLPELAKPSSPSIRITRWSYCSVCFTLYILR
jgi:hypothetical protein